MGKEAVEGEKRKVDQTKLKDDWYHTRYVCFRTVPLLVLNYFEWVLFV